MTDPHPDFVLRDSDATELFGAALARTLSGGAGVQGAVIFLHGELGAGKTTCARSLLRALGVGGLIRSPTYTLVEVYEPGNRVCVHVDLYRLSGPLDTEALGLRDYLDAGCLLLVEWPDRGGAALPAPDLELTFRHLEHGRGLRVSASSMHGDALLDILVRDTSLSPYLSNLT